MTERWLPRPRCDAKRKPDSICSQIAAVQVATFRAAAAKVGINLNTGWGAEGERESAAEYSGANISIMDKNHFFQSIFALHLFVQSYISHCSEPYFCLITLIE